MTKRCIVVGGSGAVGSAICRTLNQEEARVAFTYHTNEAKAIALAQELKSPVYLRCDLSNFDVTRKTIHHAAEALGGLDALILAAGTSGADLLWKCASASNYDKLQQIDENAFDEMMSINARGTLAACQA